MAVTLLAAPVAGARTPHSAKSAHPVGSELQGGPSGKTEKLPEGVQLQLGAGARIRFERSTRLTLGKAGEPTTRALTLDLLSGRLDVRVPKARPPRIAVLVRAPHKVSAVVKGGHGIVLDNKAGVTVAAPQGEMLTAIGNDWRVLAEGMVRNVGPAAASTRPHAMLGATRLAVSQPLLLSLTGKAENTSAVWLPVRGAARYEVTVSRRDGSVVRTIRTTSHTAHLGRLAPGLYEVRARPVDCFGLEGPLSEPDTVRVVGVELPPGSFVSDGTVLLGRGQRARFTHIDGVEVSYDAATTYIPAPMSIGLARGNSTRVRFRAAGAKDDSAALVLAPRALSARIQIGPQMAHWPNDKVTVRVRVVDWNGRPVPSWIKLEPSVKVNVAPVDVRWVHHGNVLSAVVPTPSVPGPWVVRVEVHDQFGEELGRNFLEVAQAPSRVASAR